MNMLLKFNQRAEHLDENSTNFFFGIIVEKTNSGFSFSFVNNQGRTIEFISLNEWKIYEIRTRPYFTREKVYLKYADPQGVKRTLESGGMTLPNEVNGDLYVIANVLLCNILLKFHEISCFENIQRLKLKIDELKNEGNDEWRRYDFILGTF
jgi:hypothetical protein